jgi:hypothetical protein
MRRSASTAPECRTSLNALLLIGSISFGPYAHRLNMTGASTIQHPATAPPAAISQVATRCFHGAHEATGVSRQNATRTAAALMNPAPVRMTSVITSGVPMMGAARTAITAAGTSAFLIAMFINSSLAGLLQQVIRQTCLSPRFGMIGQRFPAADEAFPFINRYFTKSEALCKGNSTSFFSLRASRELPHYRHLPPKRGRYQP